jgi:hypothetical protein
MGVPLCPLRPIRWPVDTCSPIRDRLVFPDCVRPTVLLSHAMLPVATRAEPTRQTGSTTADSPMRRMTASLPLRHQPSGGGR